jgi:DNA-binding NarL/FixJ family response regulator
LVIDDDIFFANYVANLLTDAEGYLVTQSHSVDEGLKLARRGNFPLVLVDLKMPSGSHLDSLETSGGHKTGLVVAREIRKTSPLTKVIIQSAAPEAELDALPSQIDGVTFFRKSSNPAELIGAVKKILDPKAWLPKAFIVHGHDRKTVLELKNYLQNRLGFEEPIVLAEQPSSGLTIVEKFEVYASDADWVFVLLTPDDTGHAAGVQESIQFRARQNVIFELGYFYGLLNRRSGRIILLYKGVLEIPSDLKGIVYIDITHGIEAAGESIRRDLARQTESLL